MNGKVSGTVNGQVLEDLDLHAYILTKDGRTYTAIGRVNAALGHALQVIAPHSHSHTHSLSLSLPHTHTHRHLHCYRPGERCSGSCLTGNIIMIIR